MIHGEAYFLWNWIFCAISLLLGGKLAGLGTPRASRLWGSAAACGACALAALLCPGLTWPTLLIWPAAVYSCYQPEGGPACLRAFIGTLAASFLLGGCGELLLRLNQPPALSMSLSGLMGLMLWTLATLLPSTLCEVRQVEIGLKGRFVLLPAMLDSGNLLKDPFTGLPVMVISAKALEPILPEFSALCALETLPPGFRLLSVRTAAGRALWPLFHPDSCRVYVNGETCAVRAMVAVAGEYGGVQALVPAAALPAAAARVAAVTTEAAV